MKHFDSMVVGRANYLLFHLRSAKYCNSLSCPLALTFLEFDRCICKGKGVSMPLSEVEINILEVKGLFV